GIRDTAHQTNVETDLNIANADGAQWPNDPEDAAPPGTYIYPVELGGNRVFNDNGIPANTVSMIADFRNSNLRNSIRSANNLGFTLIAPVYAGMGASNPNGCFVRYVAADVVMDDPSCSAGNAQGFFRAGPLSAQHLSQTPAPLSSNWKEYTDLLGSGITFWAVDPHAMDNPEGYWQSL